MQPAVSSAPASADPRTRSALRRNNLPVPPNQGRSLPERILKSKWTWLVLALLLVEAFCFWRAYETVVPDKPVPGGTMVGTGTEVLAPAAGLAVLTVIPLTLLFLWSDRFRPHGWVVWLVTFGWGASVAVYASLELNTLAASYLGVVGSGNPAAGARPAVFVAPFVEEAMKGSILFLLALFVRNRFVSKLSGIALAGLSASAFAFVENVVYYGRRYRAVVETTGAGDPDEAMFDMFVQRGLITFFGHPLFTAMIGIGLAIGLRSKSKLVRVLAPVTGFLVAALLHMVFNGVVSLGLPTEALLIPLLLVAYPMVIALVIYSVRQVLTEKHLIAARLTDYARMGWLPESDAHWASRLTTRARVLWQSLWEGHLLTTWRLQRSLTELAYLRDSMARGLVDHGGLVRETQLLHRIRDLRERGIVEPRPKTRYPWQRAREKPLATWAPPGYPGPAGLTGSYPVADAPEGGPPPAYATTAPPMVPGGVPLGSSATTYAPVDPRWKPPTS